MVDFAMFQKMSKGDAAGFLQKFLELGRGNCALMVAAAKVDGVDGNFSPESVPALLAWASVRLCSTAREEDPAEPDWVRKSASYKSGLYDFDPASVGTVLSCAYYLGESFVRAHSGLVWSTGLKDTIEVNMPVVSGFSKSIELAPIMVADNLLRRIHQGADRAILAEAVQTWLRLVPGGGKSKALHG